MLVPEVDLTDPEVIALPAQVKTVIEHAGLYQLRGGVGVVGAPQVQHAGGAVVVPLAGLIQNRELVAQEIAPLLGAQRIAGAGVRERAVAERRDIGGVVAPIGGADHGRGAGPIAAGLRELSVLQRGRGGIIHAQPTRIREARQGLQRSVHKDVLGNLRQRGLPDVAAVQGPARHGHAATDDGLRAGAVGAHLDVSVRVAVAVDQELAAVLAAALE